VAEWSSRSADFEDRRQKQLDRGVIRIVVRDGAMSK
jgi:hypothetical protein